jgi:hypothetical protein
MTPLRAMRRPLATLTLPLMLAVGIAAAMLAGCRVGAQPFILAGDANAVEIGYSADPGTTLPLARRHCLQFERVPQFLDADGESAIYACVPR